MWRGKYFIQFRRQLSTDVVEMKYNGFQFQIKDLVRKDKQRRGTLTTPHGVVETPAFIFCATKGAMKGVTTEVMRQEKTQIILSNTYHLLLAPGPDIIQKLGGLQKCTGWRGPMLTDSGGYQIFSMGHGSVSDEIKGKKNTPEGWNRSLLKITEEGATFKSYINGSIHHLTPELSIDIQRKLGADLIVVLDECTPFNVDKEYTASSMRRSHRWADRSLQQFIKTQDTVSLPQALYGIIQGGVYPDLRKESVEYINNLPVFGIAIGGSLGSNRDMMKEIIEFTCEHIRKDRPIHLLGIGGVADIFHGVRQGIDSFDCVHPSRLGRHGGALVKAKYWTDDLQNLDQLIELQKRKIQEFVQNIPEELQKMMRKKKEKKMRKKNFNQNPMEPGQEMELKRDDGKEGEGEDQEEQEEEEVVPTSINSQKLKKIQQQQKKLQSELKILQTRLKRSIRPHISLLNSSFQDDCRPIDESCHCSTCRGSGTGTGTGTSSGTGGYSRGYLHHLLKTNEMLGPMLITIHNVYFMNELMSEIRRGIEEDRLDEIEREYVHEELK